MKIFYLFDEHTKENKGLYEAQESPLEPGEYIRPVCSTPAKPLPEVEGKYNYFNGKKFELSDDTRGIWYKPTREQIEITDLLETIDATWSRVQPPLTSKEIANNSIRDLESTVTARRLREAVLGIDDGWLDNLNSQIATLRAVQ